MDFSIIVKFTCEETNTARNKSCSNIFRQILENMTPCSNISTQILENTTPCLTVRTLVKQNLCISIPLSIDVIFTCREFFSYSIHQKNIHSLNLDIKLKSISQIKSCVSRNIYYEKDFYDKHHKNMKKK